MIHSESQKRATEWQDDWSWFVEILSGKGTLEEQRQVNRHLRQLQADIFRLLPEAIEDAAHPSTSWQNPFVRIDLDFPYEWGTEIPVGSLDPEIHGPDRDLMISLAVLTAGVAIWNDDGILIPLFPQPISRYIEDAPEREIKSCLKSWIDPEEWLSGSVYGDNDSEDTDDRTVTGRGDGVGFVASLWFVIYPRMIDFKKRTSRFSIEAGIPWDVLEGTPPPWEWTNAERGAFWKVISRFFDTLQQGGDDLASYPEKITEVVGPASERDRFRTFEASFRNYKGIHFAEKASLRTIDKTVLERVPEYARGEEGPILDISDGNGKLGCFAISELASVMNFPTSKAQRLEYVAHFAVGYMTEKLPQILKDEYQFTDDLIEEHWPHIQSELARNYPQWFSREIYAALNYGPSFDELMSRAQTGMSRGVIAGDMLLYILICAKHHTRHISLRKARHLTKWQLIEDNKYSDNFGEGFLKESWEEYKSVAHLWAACNLLSVSADREQNFPSGPGSGIINLIAMAEKIRMWGESEFARGRRKKGGPILDPTATWRAPADLLLPDVTLEPPPLSEWALSHLAKYYINNT